MAASAHASFSLVYGNFANWSDAQAAAIAQGGNLAIIASPADQSAVSAIVPQGQEFWIGGLQHPITEPVAGANWFWYNGSKITSFYWNGGEPNDAGGAGAEQYLTFDNRNGNHGWNDEGYPSNVSGYVLETPAVPEPSTWVAGVLTLAGLVGMRRRQA